MGRKRVRLTFWTASAKDFHICRHTQLTDSCSCELHGTSTVGWTNLEHPLVLFFDNPQGRNDQHRKMCFLTRADTHNSNCCRLKVQQHEGHIISVINLTQKKELGDFMVPLFSTEAWIIQTTSKCCSNWTTKRFANYYKLSEEVMLFMQLLIGHHFNFLLSSNPRRADLEAYMHFDTFIFFEQSHFNTSAPDEGWPEPSLSGGTRSERFCPASEAKPLAEARRLFPSRLM